MTDTRISNSRCVLLRNNKFYEASAWSSRIDRFSQIIPNQLDHILHSQNDPQEIRVSKVENFSMN
ncbi:uncharacterized protein PHALS_15439 [Plasmopara halstedii]|uniref:Uncharacterized protein n=1 Tax=Plasmopara halstedii TaxID=4781 RepID=A0A0N7L530_PLAHL|nr:uncharacterized protein PHALS_15439 [Plasmopara halstedii]CEG40331.1 hypothetical protein PHALS_15439 [Plasmopara halstedii]|eukprot:XP_024576700.1 hypothetical protein PHALS_15439 [Plasmopara halstedii]